MKEGILLPYLAGLFDGEGNIHIYKKKDRRSSRGFIINSEIAITNTKPIIITLFSQLHKGNKVIIEPKKSTHRTIFRITYTNFNAILFVLKKIAPFIQLKKEEVKTAIAYCESRLSHFKSGYTKEEIEFIEKLHKLNQGEEYAKL